MIPDLNLAPRFAHDAASNCADGIAPAANKFGIEATGKAVAFTFAPDVKADEREHCDRELARNVEKP